MTSEAHSSAAASASEGAMLKGYGRCERIVNSVDSYVVALDTSKCGGPSPPTTPRPRRTATLAFVSALVFTVCSSDSGGAQPLPHHGRLLIGVVQNRGTIRQPQLDQPTPVRGLRARDAPGRPATACIVGMVFVVTTCPLAASAAPFAEGTSHERTVRPYAVPAVRQPLSTNAESPVIHDTETDALVAHDGRLFATTDQWEYSSPSPAGQILVKDSARSPWKVFEQTQGLRVSEALDSFPIPSDQGLGPGHSLLITHAVIDGRSEIQWLLDGAKAFSPRDSFTVPSNVFDVRSFGAHESGGVWAVYAGVEPTGSCGARGPRPSTPWSSTPRPS